MPEQAEKKVADVMIPVRNYKTISHHCTVEDAVTLMHKSFYQRGKNGLGHRSVIVCDDYGNPLGMVTFRSILQALEPFFARASKFSVPIFWEGLFSERCKAEGSKNIKEIMYPFNFVALDVNDTLIKAVHAMIKHKLGTLPVTRNNQLVGMIRANEVFEEAYSVMVDHELFEEAVTS